MTIVPKEISASAVKASAVEKITPMMQQYLWPTFFYCSSLAKKANHSLASSTQSPFSLIDSKKLGKVFDWLIEQGIGIHFVNQRSG